MKKQISYKIVSLVFSILVLCFAIAFYAIGWDEPTDSPPGGNVPAPLNTSSEAQAKIGGLLLNTGGYPNGLIVDQGNVGIGTTEPGAKLHVGGTPGTDGIMFPDGTLQTTAGGGGFGDWTNLDSGGNPLVINVVYKVTSDGFLIWTSDNLCCPTAFIDIGPTNPPADITLNHDRGYSGGVSIETPIKRDFYFRIRRPAGDDYGGADHIRWVPIGNGQAIRQ